MYEFLVVLATLSTSLTAGQVGERVHVLSTYPPRLLVVVASSDQASTLRQMPGVEAVLAKDDVDLPTSLSDSERLFAEAWLQRGALKQRPGEGKSWDTDGFLPPDRPPRR